MVFGVELGQLVFLPMQIQQLQFHRQQGGLGLTAVQGKRFRRRGLAALQKAEPPAQAGTLMLALLLAPGPFRLVPVAELPFIVRPQGFQQGQRPAGLAAVQPQAEQSGALVAPAEPVIMP